MYVRVNTCEYHDGANIVWNLKKCTTTKVTFDYFTSPTMTFIRFVAGKSSGISSGILSGISSGILSGISSGILSDILSGVLSGISSGILSGR